MLGSVEVLLLALLTFAAIAWCLRHAMRTKRDGERTIWVVLLALGVVIWPLGWVTCAAYALDARRARRPA